jgi:hypothetical protein
LASNNTHVKEVYRTMHHIDLNMIRYEMLDPLKI